MALWNRQKSVGSQDPNEETLIRKSRRGDERAFEALVSHYRNRVHFTVFRILQDTEEARDATQETFIKVWRNLPKVRTELTFSTWLYRVAVNTALDRLRQRKHYLADDLEEIDVKVTHLDRARNSPRDLARGEEFRRAVDRALGSLPPRQKAVFVLRHFEGLKLREIAQVLDYPLGTVKANLHHAVINLRNMLLVSGAVDEGDLRNKETNRTPGNVRSLGER